MVATNSSLISFFLIYLRGLAMGAADVVPGVSGGTIAFITGIYKRLLQAIRNIALPITLRQLITGQFKALWFRVDANFLLILFAGVFTSLFGLATLIKWLMQTYPLPLWSFFFGLVLGSVVFMVSNVRPLVFKDYALITSFAAIGYLISSLAPTELNNSALNFFFAGAIAICAMILPGISGSFILLLMGMYGPVIGAIESLDIGVLLFFLLGNVIGLLSFSHVLTWAFSRFERETLAALIGIMLGSLSKLWPWKETLEVHINRHGETIPLVQKNILPSSYEQLTTEPSHLFWCAFFMAAGLGLIFFIDYLLKAKKLLVEK